jgi:ornithine carbamoyltransferase
MAVVPHLMTLADLSAPQIRRAVSHAYHLKQLSTPWLAPQLGSGKQPRLRMPSQSLFNKSIALLFSKRSTRTRVAAETAALLLGGRALFLGKDDIQLGVNESPRDTARVLGGMCQGIFARVGDHSEIEVRGTSRVHNLHIRILTPAISYLGTRKVLTRTSPECIVFPLASYTSSRRPSHTSRACTPL